MASRPGLPIAVLGGGISGLTSAFYLSRALPSKQVVLLESTDRLGGWIRSSKVPTLEGTDDHLVFENGPRSVRPAGLPGLVMLDLLRKLDLGSAIIPIPKTHPSAKNRFIYYPNKLNKLPPSLPELLFLDGTKTPVLKGVISAILKEPFRPRRRDDVVDESLDSFIRRRFGADVAENLFSAIIHGIYAGDTRQLSVRSVMGSLWDLEKKYGSVVLGLLRGGMKKSDGERKLEDEVERGLGNEWMTKYVKGVSVYSLRGGLETVVGRMERELRDSRNVEVRKKFSVEGMKTEHDGIVLESPAGPLKVSHLVSSIPSTTLSRILSSPSSSAPSLPHLSRNPSVTVGVVNLAFPSPRTPGKRLLPVEGFGYLIPRSVKEEMNPHKALGVVFDSDMMPGMDSNSQAEGGGFTKMSVLLGGHHWSSLSTFPTAGDLQEQALNVVETHLGISKSLSPPSHVQVHIQRDCIPQYLVGHKERMRDLHRVLMDGKTGEEKGVVGWDGRLSLVGASYSGVGVNDCVKSAWDAARRLNQHGRSSGLEGFA